ncbi:hypothetical protein ACHWQZ_G013556 [Mnemiopsis leidyi]
MSSDDEPLVDAGTPDTSEVDPAEFGCLGDGALCNPLRRPHRFVVLSLICFLSFGSYYCYDNPAALAPQFKTDLDLEGKDFMLLYSLYSWPNVFLCFLGGYLIDKVFGIRLGAFLFGLVITIGQIIFAAGAYLNNRYVMYAGRFVFGLGGENLAVAGNTYVVSWFGGKEINTVFGIQLSFSRIGSTVGMVTLLPFYKAIASNFGEDKAHLMGTLLFFGAGLCILSLLASVVLALLDVRASKILRKEASGTGESIKLSDITRFSAATWLIFAICVTYYVAIFPFISLGKLFFEQKFGLTQDEAGICNSLVYFIGAGASPIAGLLIDRYGRNVMWLLSAILITLGAYALLAFTFIHPYVAMVMMAIAYSMCASALWPMVSLVVPEYQLGTAYGMMQSIQNLGLALVSIAAGTIAEKYGYFLLALQFMAWLALSAVFIVILWVWDAGNGGYLNASPAKRKEMNQDEIRSVLEGEEYRDPLISDGSVLDVSQTFRASTARELRNKYMGKIESGKQQDFTRSAEFHRSLADQSINLGQSYQFSSNANRGLLK